MITIKDIAWVTGIIDGEGSFEMFTDSAYPRITVAMTDMDIIIRVAEILGADAVRAKKTPLHIQQQYIVRINGDRALRWCMTLYALLGERRRARVRQILKHWQTHVPKRIFKGAHRRVPEHFKDAFSERAAELYRSGLSQREVALVLKTSQPQISKVMRRSGVNLRPGTRGSGERARVVWQSIGNPFKSAAAAAQ